MSFLKEIDTEDIVLLDIEENEEMFSFHIEEAMKKHLSLLEENWEFVVNCNGIQENNLLLRKEGKEWATKNFDSIFAEVLPMQHHDPTDVSYYLFGYFSWHFYKQQKKIPMTYTEFERILCSKPELIDFKHNTPMKDLSKFNTLKLTAEAAKMVEEKYKDSNMEEFEEIIPSIVETLTTNLNHCRIAEKTLLQHIPNFQGLDSVNHLNSFFIKMSSSNLMSIWMNDVVTNVPYRIENETAHFYKEGYGDYMPQIKNMFYQVENEMKQEYSILEHFYSIRDTLEKKKIYCRLNKEKEAYLYSISFDGWSKKIFIISKDDKLYRTTGEEILVPNILTNELYNLYLEAQEQNQKWNKNKDVYYQRSKQLFSQLLSGAEKEHWEEKNIVTVEGERYNYVICTKMGHNSIVRIPKNGDMQEAKALCITSNDPFIPKYDIFSTVVMMIKSKKEKMMNGIANQFNLNSYHKKILKAI